MLSGSTIKRLFREALMRKGRENKTFVNADVLVKHVQKQESFVIDK